MCLDGIHVKLAALESAHGGMDEAPASVHEAHGVFDTCWRNGTKDPVRDATTIATQVCDCRDTPCIRTWRLATLHTLDKYGVTDAEALTTVPGATPAVAAALERGARCLDAVTIKGDALLAIVDKAATEMCTCKDAACAQTAMATRGKALANYLEVADLASVQDRVDSANARFCKCMGTVMATEIADKMLPFRAKIDVDVSCR